MSIAAAADRAAPAETSPQASARWPLCGALATVALAAPLFALGGWLALDSHPAILFYAVPIVAAELAVIALAIADGFDMRAALARLAPATRAGAAGWLVAIALANLAIAARAGAALPLMLTSVVHALFGLALWAMLGSAWAHRRKAFPLAACAVCSCSPSAAPSTLKPTMFPSRFSSATSSTTSSADTGAAPRASTPASRMPRRSDTTIR